MRKESIIITTSIFLAFALLTSCATKPVTPQVPQIPNPMKGENTDAAVDFSQAQNKGEIPDKSTTTDKAASPADSQNQIEIKIIDYKTPEEDSLASAGKTDTTTKPEEVIQRQNITMEVKPTVENYAGGAVVYNYIPNHVYRIYTAPFQITNIVLEPGEKIINAPAAGDTLSFICGTSYFIENGRQRQEILLKAIYPGKKTTLNVATDRRNYTFNVLSLPTTFMPLVSFDYPLDTATELQNITAEKARDIPMAGSITDLDFGYAIIPQSIHQPKWMPSIVFNDGQKTYINFASASRAAYAPVLFEVTDKNKRVLVNYRVKGTYFVVDRVLTRFDLILDVNEGNIISVMHK